MFPFLGRRQTLTVFSIHLKFFGIFGEQKEMVMMADGLKVSSSLIVVIYWNFFFCNFASMFLNVCEQSILFVLMFIWMFFFGLVVVMVAPEWCATFTLIHRVRRVRECALSEWHLLCVCVGRCSSRTFVGHCDHYFEYFECMHEVWE